MWLSKIHIQNCRVINTAKLDFHPKLNLIYGSNGSGKTSLLEALSILSLGRSFRTSRISEVISYEQDSVLVSSQVCYRDKKSGENRIGIQKSAAKTLIRVNRQTLGSQSALSKIVPLTIIHPQSHELITGGSSKRRGFIDWIAFYQYPEFHGLWKRYHYILKQRNAALKSKKLEYALEHLTLELCMLQPPLHAYREQALNSFKLTLVETIPGLLIEFSPELELTTGLPSGIELETEALIQYYQSKQSYEKRTGRTSKGIHTADLKISLDQQPAASSASRGQTKILSLLLHIAQSLTITQHGIIAIDDLHAEIDEDNYQKLIEFVIKLGRQLFITSTSRPDKHTILSEHSMFHVKHGVVSQTS